MPAARSRGVLVRRLAPIALMPAAAFAVHELRYLLAFGGHAGAELQRQGHSYLHSLVPWIVLLLALATGIFVKAMRDAFRGQSSLPRYTASFTALWLVCAGSLLCIYVAQELLEGWFATGHPAALAGIFGYGGWWAIPAALVIGLLLAALLHGAREMLAAIAHRSRSCGVQTREPASPPRPRAPFFARPAALASGWSGRGPPV